MQSIKSKLSDLLRFTKAFVLAVFLLLAAGAYAWSAPTQAPTSGNIAAPLNTGGSVQQIGSSNPTYITVGVVSPNALW